MKNKKHFISFLGRSDYRPCKYRYDNKESPEVTYVQTATCRFKGCDQATVFCTIGARERHANGLVAEFKKHDLPKVDIVDIPDGASEDQLWEIFQIVRDAVAEGDEIVFDVTHSLRSLPVIMTVLLRYLAVAKGVVLGACLYGAWDVRDKEDIAPVFDLTPFFTLDDWTHAIRGFELFGDASELKALAHKYLAPRCADNNSARSLNSAIREIALFAGNVCLANLGGDNPLTGLRAMDLKTNISSPLTDEKVADDIPGLSPLSPILNRISRQFSEYGDSDVRNGFRAARWAAEHGLIPQAFTLLQETTVSIVQERYSESLPDGLNGIAAREFVSGVLAKASDPQFDWHNWNKPEGSSLIAQNLAGTLNKDLVLAYASLTRRRNAINHAGTNNQEPIVPNSPDYQLDGFREIASKIEDTLSNYILGTPICPGDGQETILNVIKGKE